MQYGFAVVRMECGEWLDEPATPHILKVRLFRTKKERDNGIKLEQQRRALKGHYWWEVDYSTFITK